MKFNGTWHICEMEMWDEDYFNMETQAAIKIDRSGLGFFNFGVVSGEIDGEVVKNDMKNDSNLLGMAIANVTTLPVWDGLNSRMITS